MSIHLKPFPQLRQTDIPWYGALPSHWQLCPGMAVLKPKQIKNVGLREKTVLSLSYGRIVIKPEEKLHGLVPASFEGYQIVEPGNVIIRPTDLQNDQTSLRVGQSEHRGIITSAYLCLEARGDMNAAYAYALLHAYDIQKVFYSMGSGLRQNLDWSDFRRLPIPVPPPEEQDAIVRFVRHLDLRVNRLLKTKRRLIELLNEQKQAIIHRAVTRGLDPDVALKPSGVEWLGDVPEHWEVKRLRYACRFNPTKSELSINDETLLSFLPMEKVGTGGEMVLDENRPLKDLLGGLTYFRDEDVIVAKITPCFENGKGALVNHLTNGAGFGSTEFHVLRPHRSLSPQYLYMITRSRLFRSLGTASMYGAGGQKRVPEDFIKNFIFAFPPLAEQNAIIAKIDSETRPFDKAITKAKSEIDFIREYRTRLVSDVVTGQLDVRGLALPEMDDATESLGDVAEDGDGLPGEEPEGDNE